MKILVVFYSRTGKTRKMAELLSQAMKCDQEEIMDTKKRHGLIGWIISGRDGVKELTTKIGPVKKDPAKYDLVIIGTPIWAGNISSAIRTYLLENKDKIKRAAFFCAMGNSPGKAFESMEKILNKKPAAVLGLTSSEIMRNKADSKIKDFISKI